MEDGPQTKITQGKGTSFALRIRAVHRRQAEFTRANDTSQSQARCAPKDARPRLWMGRPHVTNSMARIHHPARQPSTSPPCKPDAPIRSPYWTLVYYFNCSYPFTTCHRAVIVFFLPLPFDQGASLALPRLA